MYLFGAEWWAPKEKKTYHILTLKPKTRLQLLFIRSLTLKLMGLNNRKENGSS